MPCENAPPSGEEGEAFFQTILEVSGQQIEGIGALAAPADIQPEVDSIVAEALAIRTQVETDGAKALFASDADPWEPVNGRLLAIGLADCVEQPGE